jgi:hypothetical protein
MISRFNENIEKRREPENDKRIQDYTSIHICYFMWISRYGERESHFGYGYG